ncbi:acid phosphatase/vanadium-dependent haloperoxidase protein-related protein, partial [Tanacetum coccineum]
DFVPAYVRLLRDNEAEVRIAAAGKVTKFSRILGLELAIQHILPCVKLCEAVGPEPTKTDFVPAYVRLLRDNEAEVRIAAAGKVTKFSRIFGLELTIQHILPCVKGSMLLLNDEFPDVRLNIISDLNRSFVPIFTACSCGTGLRQTLENYLVIHIGLYRYIRYKELCWDLEQLIGSGGMPPSHSATVTAFAVAFGLHDGLGSSTFATALILACIVMYDATGEGLHAGRQAEVLNQIVFELPAEHPLAESRPLRELLGHTPPQYSCSDIRTKRNNSIPVDVESEDDMLSEQARQKHLLLKKFTDSRPPP